MDLLNGRACFKDSKSINVHKANENPNNSNKTSKSVQVAMSVVVAVDKVASTEMLLQILPMDCMVMASE